MYYLERVQKAINYIEDNLNQPLSVADVASAGHLSQYHFHRIFQTMVGDSVMGYVRKRRLSAAAQKLHTSNRRVLDIALEFQFDSQEAFTRAFKRQFGITPGKCRLNRDELLLTERKSFVDNGLTIYYGGIFMEPKIMTIKEIKVAGPKIRSTPENGQNFIQVPQFWQKFLKEKGWEKIPNKTERAASFGICTNMHENGDFDYMIGYEVKDFSKIPDGMGSLIIPAGKYAVFTAKGKIPEKIQEVWKYIYSDWFKSSGYERADTEDFELYEEARVNLPEPETDIYIPIK